MRLEQDAKGCSHGPTYSSVSIDDGYVAQLRLGIAGNLTDRELAELVVHQINFFLRAGNTDAQFGSPEWRALAISLCQAGRAQRKGPVRGQSRPSLGLHQRQLWERPSLFGRFRKGFTAAASDRLTRLCRCSWPSSSCALIHSWGDSRAAANCA